MPQTSFQQNLSRATQRDSRVVARLPQITLAEMIQVPTVGCTSVWTQAEAGTLPEVSGCQRQSGTGDVVRYYWTQLIVGHRPETCRAPLRRLSAERAAARPKYLGLR